MNKKFFPILVILMAIALIGIITVQVIWINSSNDIREKQFDSNVKLALLDVSQSIKDREYRKYLRKWSPVLSELNNLKNRELREIIFQKLDTVNNELFTYKQSFLEDTFVSPVGFFNSSNNNQSQTYKSYFSKKEKEISSLKNRNEKDISDKTHNDRVVNISKMSVLDKIQFEQMFKEIAPRTPIYKRVSNAEIRFKITNELKRRGIETPFEYAVLETDLLTKVKSLGFIKKTKNSYPVSLFKSETGNSNYILYVDFPAKQHFIFSTLKQQLLLAFAFISLIFAVFVFSIYQMMKQKKLSETKTDFINNMTHEFKTPIATINLALDAIKNPKVINDNEKVLGYIKMIREENKRMHAQVENVLQISKLEKKQLEISKEMLDIHDIIDSAINHISLIVQNKGGYVKKHFSAIQTEMAVNKMYMSSVIVNVLDNAIKYTNGAPKIDVYTENAGNFVLIKIKDQGIGMNKNVQKNIFNKFFRAQKGNVHDVKGHGLGLSYVKKIVENHRGTVYVESIKGKGSTFFIKLPIV